MMPAGMPCASLELSAASGCRDSRGRTWQAGESGGRLWLRLPARCQAAALITPCAFGSGGASTVPASATRRDTVRMEKGDRGTRSAVPAQRGGPNPEERHGGKAQAQSVKASR